MKIEQEPLLQKDITERGIEINTTKDLMIVPVKTVDTMTLTGGHSPEMIKTPAMMTGEGEDPGDTVEGITVMGQVLFLNQVLF